jgi:hypothetical protein
MQSSQANQYPNIRVGSSWTKCLARGPRVKRDYVEKYTSNPFAMQVPNATGSALQRCSFLNSSNALFFLLDNFALSTEQTDDSNTIEEDFRGSDGYE